MNSRTGIPRGLEITVKSVIRKYLVTTFPQLHSEYRTHIALNIIRACRPVCEPVDYNVIMKEEER